MLNFEAYQMRLHIVRTPVCHNSTTSSSLVKGSNTGLLGCNGRGSRSCAHGLGKRENCSELDMLLALGLASNANQAICGHVRADQRVTQQTGLIHKTAQLTSSSPSPAGKNIWPAPPAQYSEAQPLAHISCVPSRAYLRPSSSL